MRWRSKWGAGARLGLMFRAVAPPALKAASVSGLELHACGDGKARPGLWLMLHAAHTR